MGHLRRFRRQMGSTPKKPQSSPGKPDGPAYVDLERSELEAILERAKAALSQEQYDTLHAAMETLIFLTQELEKKHVSIQRLKQMLFGATTESTRKVMEQILEETEQERELGGDDKESQSPPESSSKAKGHGRNGTDAYTGADTVRVPHDTLKPGDPCPACKKGTVYGTAPGRIIRIRGQAPLGATVYELQKLRCNLCGEIFTAPPPAGVGAAKYDAESASMIALLKYGSGVPFNRLARLEGSLGIPLPAATQWEIAEQVADRIEPVYEAMVHRAAQGRLLHNDDTTMKVLELCRRQNPWSQAETARKSERKGVFTSGIVSVVDDHRIALFFTGHQHAGENLAELLTQRHADRQRPIQMCDALSRNAPEPLKTILGNCLTHGRRRFIEVAANFPQKCLYVLDVLKKVYANDDEAKYQGLSDQQRLQWHQTRSGPPMEKLKIWMTEQIEQKKVEPNSGLGEAIGYMLRHWQELTLFLRQPGAPLDNNVCERALKKVILHRKNAYFYKTLNGARVGDLFMSIIHTCELNKINPFDYLTQLQKHIDAAIASPADWMPWNYRNRLQSTGTHE
jgi:transposase